MSNINDKRVLNAILNPNTPFEEEEKQKQTSSVSKYEISSDIQEAKSLEIEGSESIESLTEKHRKEKKELQSKIQSLKKSITKGDKKKKKEIDSEIEKLEKEFEQKCQLELANLNVKLTSSTETKSEDKQFNDEQKQSKLSKTQKRKEKKEKNEKEREKLIALQEIQNKKGPAAIELGKIREKLRKKRLRVKEVKSDGNCMYYAVSDQLEKLLSISKSYQELRDLTCDYMLKNREEFQPYLTSDDGDLLDTKKYEEYCEKIKDPTIWGGQLELKALSDILNVLIEVVQAEGSEIVIGNDNKLKDKLIITYHRHMFGSGEHYNSTEPELLESDQD